METSLTSRALYYITKAGSNNITCKGVKSLIHANWKYLIRLELGTQFTYRGCNPIGASGCKILSQS